MSNYPRKSKSGLPEALHGASDTPTAERKPDQCEAPNCRSRRIRVGTSLNGEPEFERKPGNADIHLRDKRGNLIMAICQECYAKGQVASGNDQLSQVKSASPLQARTIEGQLEEMLLECGKRPDTNVSTAKARFAAMANKLARDMQPPKPQLYTKPPQDDSERPWGMDIDEWERMRRDDA